MQNLELNRSWIDDALEMAEIFPDDDADPVRDNYSGRGMYGVTCLGIVVSGMSEAFKFFAALADPNCAGPEVAFEVARHARTDNMGLDMIVYFPGVTLVNA